MGNTQTNMTEEEKQKQLSLILGIVIPIILIILFIVYLLRRIHKREVKFMKENTGWNTGNRNLIRGEFMDMY